MTRSSNLSTIPEIEPETLVDFQILNPSIAKVGIYYCLTQADETQPRI